jgi:DNA-directed RNA polymerase subunit alpha
MEQVASDQIASVVAKEAWTADDYKALLGAMTNTADGSRRFRNALTELEASNPEAKGTAALKIGIGRYMLCRFGEAADALANATDNKDRHYFQALCFKSLRQYDKAAQEIERAKERGWDGMEMDLQLAEIKALFGDAEGAAKLLSKLQAKAGDSADFLYVQGLAAELSNQGAAAVECYTQARKKSPSHTAATFRLAYYCDLHGEEEQAIELYKELLSRPPVCANALLNLSVIHEDNARYDQAMACIKRVLASLPNHARARLFLKDIDAAKTMFFDEDQAKRQAKRNAVLDTPVTDFELSVRARNCLKKMNIRNLGDLVRTTEADLLGYKNFGETSLKEIKDMLNARNLRLGQALEDEPLPGVIAAPAEPAPPPAPVADEGVLATPIEQVELSIRARRAIDSLKIVTLGELAAKSEAELLGCKNFGQTSLNEIRQKLNEYGLHLREAATT